MVLSVQGEVDVVTAPVLNRLIASLDDGAPRVVVDMSGVTFIDSSGVGALIEVRRHLHQAGREMLVEAPSPFVARVLDLTDAEDLLPANRRGGPG